MISSLTHSHCVQENFVCQTNSGEMFFRNGEPYPGQHRKYIMEHAGSKGKVTAGEMWEFLTRFITHKDMGLIANYMKVSKKKISKRMNRLINRMRKQMGHILVDVPVHWRHINERIGRELASMARIKILDIEAYQAGYREQEKGQETRCIRDSTRRSHP